MAPLVSVRRTPASPAITAQPIEISSGMVGLVTPSNHVGPISRAAVGTEFLSPLLMGIPIPMADLPIRQGLDTGVNPAGDAGDTSPQYFGWGTSTGISPPILLRTFGYSRPISVALRSLSLKPFSFGYKTPPIRFSQAGGQSAHKTRPPQP